MAIWASIVAIKVVRCHLTLDVWKTGPNVLFIVGLEDYKAKNTVRMDLVS